MRVVALISGGKNGSYNMMKCVAAGHEIVALANLKSAEEGELDSRMFTTVGNEAIQLYADAMGIPLYQAATKGLHVCDELIYQPCEGDEVEDLYKLLLRVKQEVKGGVEGVASGIMLSNYKRERLEHVCTRLGLASLAYLWGKNEDLLVDDVVKDGVDATIIRVGATGLFPDHQLGKSLKEILPSIQVMADRFEFNVGGERGEYETITTDCPLFKKKIIIEDSRMVEHPKKYAYPEVSLYLTKLSLGDKDDHQDTMLKSLSDVSEPKSQEVLQQVYEDGNAISSTDISPNTYSFVRWSGSTQIKSLQEQTADLFERFGASLHDSGCGWSDIVLIYLWLSDMSAYHQVNNFFEKYFPVHPPARVCAGMPLPDGEFICIDALLLPNTGKEKVFYRRSLHVKSISEWAPASIGHYSQAYNVDQVVFLAGQIGLDPASMTLVPSTCSQANLSLQNISSVVCHNNSFMSENIGDLVSTVIFGMCCYTTVEGGQSARKALSSIVQADKADDKPVARPVMFLHVSSLPKEADVEWHFITVKPSNKSYRTAQENKVSYWSSTEYVETAGLVSVQEAWCEKLQVGAWLVEAALPYWHYSSGSIDVKSQVLVCVDQLLSLLKRRDDVAAGKVTCVNIFLPTLGLNNHDIRTDMKSLLAQKLRSIAVAINITTTCEEWDTFRRVTFSAIKISNIAEE